LARNTQHRVIDPQAPDADLIAEAAAILRRGGLVAFPTETVYGLGANALDAEALASIYRAKRRPAHDPIIAHIADAGQLATLARDLPPLAGVLAERFWPGPLTLVLKRAADVPDNIAKGLDTIAVRMPAHPVAQALLSAAGIPVGAPSANTFTRPSATTAAHVLEDLDGRIDMVLDGGPTTIGLESTVVDLSRDTPVVLRPGGVSLEALREVLPDIALAPSYLDEHTASRAPGQMLKHYSPRAALTLYTGRDGTATRERMFADAAALQAAGQRAGLLLSEEDAAVYADEARIETLGSETALDAVGQQLFAAMRRLDRAGVDVILVRDLGRAGVGAALWDRLLRAAEGRFVDVSG
jgi:L-threonylcarbamoyladenylate synthase